ncbi:HlyD family secretion protein [Glaciimonas sp. GG7]
MALFREQARAAQQTKWLGDIVLIRPLSFSLLTSIAVLLALIVCAFLRFATYTKHSTVGGQLVPDTGLVKVYVPQTGIVIEKHVNEGQQVNVGDVLFVLSSERQSSTQGATQAAISAQVAQRQASLRDDIRQAGLLHADERSGLQNKLAGLQSERDKLTSQIAGQRDRVTLAQQTLQRYLGLMQQDYISAEQLQQKQEELLDQQNRQQALERDRIGVARELSAQQTELRELAFKQQSQLAQSERALSSADEELSESEARRRLVITAPQAGIATAVMAEVGQSVDSNHALVSIVPGGAVLRAELYAPSRAVGFVQPGDTVLIRYQAYPYQQFRHQKGTVESVSKTALPGNELGGSAAGNNGTANSSEPLYRISVALNAQTIPVYGRAQALQAGMLLEADIQQEKLHLYEWVLEPLYSLGGKL